MEDSTFEVLNTIGDACKFTSEQKGFGEPLEGATIDRKLLLVVSEVCEAQNDLRDGRDPQEVWYEPSGKPCGFPVELADAIIRLLHTARGLKIDIGARIKEKMAFNATRPNKHGRQF